MKKQSKSYLVKARVGKRLKDAVTAAADARGDSGEAEAVIVREAIGEYLSKRGYLKAEKPDTPSAAAGRKSSA